MLDPVCACGSRSSPRGARFSAWTLKEALAVPRFDRASSGSAVQGGKDRAQAFASPPPSSTRSTKVRGVLGGALEESRNYDWNPKHRLGEHNLRAASRPCSYGVARIIPSIFIVILLLATCHLAFSELTRIPRTLLHVLLHPWSLRVQFDGHVQLRTFRGQRKKFIRSCTSLRHPPSRA